MNNKLLRKTNEITQIQNRVESLREILTGLKGSKKSACMVELRNMEQELYDKIISFRTALKTVQQFTDTNIVELGILDTILNTIRNLNTKFEAKAVDELTSEMYELAEKDFLK